MRVEWAVCLWNVATPIVRPVEAVLFPLASQLQVWEAHWSGQALESAGLERLLPIRAVIRATASLIGGRPPTSRP